MESESLKTASSYINNLLLSRGLLRNGQPIEFACPEKGEGGMEATMGRVMSLVNDLILRRDRDAAQRESLSNTIRTIRADTLRQTTDLERLQSKHVEAQRKLGLAEATERSLKTQLRSAEQAARGLKEDMGRMRILVGQTRAQCANEVRKRERVIEGLKKHVGEGGRPRGSGKAVGVATITVVPGVGADDGMGKSIDTDESGYDLRMETNEFLTELASGLSAENENLSALVNKTVETLKTLSGWEREGQQAGGMVIQMDSGYENVAADVDGVIEHLRTLLTNPSFVPIEEVEMREDEIIRLREGWERMEGRWREAVQMMDGWRKRMARSGQTVNLEELKMGLSLSPLKEANAAIGQDEENIEGDTQADIDAMDDSGVPNDHTPPLEEQSDLSDSDEESNFESEPGEELQRNPEQSTNTASPKPRQVDDGKFTTIVEENTWDLAHLEQDTTSIEKSVQTDDEVSLLKTSKSQQSPQKRSGSVVKPTGSSRLPRPASTMAQQSPLTMASIVAKLAATEREADAARVRAKLKAAKLSSAATTTLKPPMNTTDGDGREPSKEDKENVPEEGIPRKRKASGRPLGGRSSRRRSTLSPWELESLILGSAALSPAKF